MSLREIVLKQYEALKLADFRGYDPFDGLESRMLRKSVLFRSKAVRLAWIQMFKRSPFNLRPAALIARGRNPKGLALLIRGLINLGGTCGERRYLDDAYILADMIISQRSPGRDYFCVGYDFFWQARGDVSIPEHTPNMVVSTFVGQAFMDLYEMDGDDKWLGYSLGIGEFIERELMLAGTGDRIIFGYLPGVKAVVHNVNLMAGAFFARLYHHSGEIRHKRFSTQSALYSLEAQRDDGAWDYGKQPHHGWVDNFHTGFNLVSLDAVRRLLGREDFDERIEKGLAYHKSNHFLEDMTPKYYDTALFPIDIHNFAQGIDTFITFGCHEMARGLVEKAVEMMWDPCRHYFYYQKGRWCTNRINYFRWSQAWMFYALSRFHSVMKDGERTNSLQG